MGVDVKATYTQHLVSGVECSYLLATQNLPPRWDFSSGASVPIAFRVITVNHIYGTQVAAPKLLHGLIAAGTDIWVRELSRKVLGQRCVPATVRCPIPPSPYLIQNAFPVLSILNILLSRSILISFDVQLSGNNTHDYRVVLLPLGHLSPSL